MGTGLTWNDLTWSDLRKNRLVKQNRKCLFDMYSAYRTDSKTERKLTDNTRNMNCN